MIEQVEALLDRVEAFPPEQREITTELVQALLDMYGEGLARIVAADSVPVEDELVAHLLLLHGLHPVPLEQRVHGALDEVRPYLESHGGDVELLGIEDGVVRLAMRGSCDGCASSTMTLKLAIEDAIQKAAPDVEEIVAEGAVEPAPAPLLQIALSDSLRPQEPTDGAWAAAGPPEDLGGEGPVVREVAGAEVLFVALDGNRYAYRPACPACGERLGSATVSGGALRCGGCGERYDVRRAGRGLDTPERHLEPVPLLVGADGVTRVAVGAGA